MSRSAGADPPDSRTNICLVQDLGDPDATVRRSASQGVFRLRDPRGCTDLTDLNFTGSGADYRALQAAVDAGVPTVAVPKLDRPLVLTNVCRSCRHVWVMHAHRRL